MSSCRFPATKKEADTLITAQIFVNVAALHDNPTDKSLESKILEDLKNCNSSNDRNRALAQFVADGLREFEQTYQVETPMIQDAKRILLADNDALMKLDFPSQDAIVFINSFRTNVAKMQVDNISIRILPGNELMNMR